MKALTRRQHAARRASLPYSATEGSRRRLPSVTEPKINLDSGSTQAGGGFKVDTTCCPHAYFLHYSRCKHECRNCQLRIPTYCIPIYSLMLHSHPFPHIAFQHIPSCCIPTYSLRSCVCASLSCRRTTQSCSRYCRCHYPTPR